MKFTWNNFPLIMLFSFVSQTSAADLYSTYFSDQISELRSLRHFSLVYQQGDAADNAQQTIIDGSNFLIKVTFEPDAGDPKQDLYYGFNTEYIFTFDSSSEICRALYAGSDFQKARAKFEKSKKVMSAQGSRFLEPYQFLVANTAQSLYRRDHHNFRSFPNVCWPDLFDEAICKQLVNEGLKLDSATENRAVFSVNKQFQPWKIILERQNDESGKLSIWRIAEERTMDTHKLKDGTQAPLPEVARWNKRRYDYLTRNGTKTSIVSALTLGSYYGTPVGEVIPIAPESTTAHIWKKMYDKSVVSYRLVKSNFAGDKEPPAKILEISEMAKKVIDIETGITIEK